MAVVVNELEVVPAEPGEARDSGTGSAGGPPVARAVERMQAVLEARHERSLRLRAN
jgi:hypothetical protein